MNTAKRIVAWLAGDGQPYQVAVVLLVLTTALLQEVALERDLVPFWALVTVVAGYMAGSLAVDYLDWRLNPNKPDTEET